MSEPHIYGHDVTEDEVADVLSDPRENRPGRDKPPPTSSTSAGNEAKLIQRRKPRYLATHPSRDLTVAAHQQITHEWWREARQRFELYIFEAVLAEIRAGDPDAAAHRLAIVDALPILGPE